jgi:hypothetical protein
MHPAYLKEKARQLRTKKQLSIDEIAARLALPKTTIYYWVRDLPLGRSPRHSPQPGNAAMQRKYRALRKAAYLEGRATFERHSADPTFRDFLCLYIGEGSKRDRNLVALCNSDPKVIHLADRWIRRFSRNPIRYSIQYHADQDLDALLAFWAQQLGVTPDAISLQRKSNGNALAGRSWRSRHGVLTVTASDTLFRARLEGWMDRIRETWV